MGHAGREKSEGLIIKFCPQVEFRGFGRKQRNSAGKNILAKKGAEMPGEGKLFLDHPKTSTILGIREKQSRRRMYSGLPKGEKKKGSEAGWRSSLGVPPLCEIKTRQGEKKEDRTVRC